MTSRAIAVIPARAGSERVPNKNFREYKEGKSLVLLAAECATEAQIFEEIFISSDNQAAEDIANSLGLRFIERPPSAASSDATATDVLLSLIQPFETHGVSSSDYLYYLQPTSPSRRIEDLRLSWERIQKDHPKGLVSIIPTSQPPYKHLSLTASGEVVSLFGDQMATSNLQSLKQTYIASGDFFSFQWGYFLEKKTFPISECLPYFVDSSNYKDIDTFDQFA